MSDKRFATLSSLKAGNNSAGGQKSRSSSGSSDDDQHRQGFFVGGSEHSGQQVLGPSSGRGGESDARDMIGQIFAAAREHGARTVSDSDLQSGSSKNKKGAFAAGGYRLGDTVRPSEALDPSGNGIYSSHEDIQNVTLRLYDNGFTVDGGPLRLFSEEGNSAFMHAIMEGRTPSELKQRYPGRVIDLRLERSSEPYVPQKPPPFSGHGQRLGEVVPTVIGAGMVGQKYESGSSGASKDENGEKDFVKKAQEEIKLREGEPVTQIQVRLPNGQRIIARFNPSHTVEDLRSFIFSAVPDLKPFYMMTAFPNRKLEEEGDTLAKAGLLNTVIIVKLK